jgi:2-polyprenyl-3-methyl-5-hydroxy-6-metoxy-1,4-benzoquinol methylase
MKLQKKFDKTLEYEKKRFEDVKDAVYLNKEYMFALYLPGIFLSHYLWPHHFRQLLWFLEDFIPLIDSNGAETFCDVGVGTGFYSKEMLRNVTRLYGRAYDISEFALQHARTMVDRWNLGRRYSVHLQDIVAAPPDFKADCAVNIEVLEHLEDPPAFLKALRHMVRDGGYAFITAAINAPNKDHIYLYRNLESVSVQLEEAGFDVVAGKLFAAFGKEKEGETVPENGSFIVRAS